MNFLRFQFRFGLFSGVMRYLTLAIGIASQFLNLRFLEVAGFAGFAILLGFDLSGWGYYTHGGDYFTVQPEGTTTGFPETSQE